MQESKHSKVNRVKLPKKLCHRFKAHRWFWSARNKAFVSGKCSRCGMSAPEYYELTRLENERSKL